MLSKEELLKSPNYLLTKYQLEIYRRVLSYMIKNNLSKKEMAEKMNVRETYISKILNGHFAGNLEKLIELCLLIGIVPKIDFIPIEQYKIEHS